MTGRVTQGSDITADVAETCDVCIIGSGAGGGVLAAGLVARGLNVVMLEAGGYHTRRDFDLQEQTAFPALYQGRGGRSTTDLAISILQGRAVGGSTTVNWTTCFRTPDRILSHWQQHHGIEGLDPQSLAPHFEAIEERLSIATWPEERANANNRKLLDGARALGWEAAPLRRNVKGCVNSGFCGMGCPVDGKQGQHVTTIPDAIAGGMRLYSDVEVRQLVHAGKKVSEVRGVVMERGRDRDTAHTVTVRPKVVALCGGAINNPVLLFRSELNPNGRVGLRTFLHPVVSMAGIYDEQVDPYYGAPQSIGSHQFIDRGPDKVGYFLEAAPMHPMLTASAAGVFASKLGELMQQLPHISGLLALQVDGLLPGDDGGTTTLRPDGRPACTTRCVPRSWSPCATATAPWPGSTWPLAPAKWARSTPIPSVYAPRPTSTSSRPLPTVPFSTPSSPHTRWVGAPWGPTLRPAWWAPTIGTTPFTISTLSTAQCCPRPWA